MQRIIRSSQLRAFSTLVRARAIEGTPSSQKTGYGNLPKGQEQKEVAKDLNEREKDFKNEKFDKQDRKQAKETIDLNSATSTRNTAV
jgi:hypothetical protein